MAPVGTHYGYFPVGVVKLNRPASLLGLGDFTYRNFFKALQLAWGWASCSNMVYRLSTKSKEILCFLLGGPGSSLLQIQFYKISSLWKTLTFDIDLLSLNPMILSLLPSTDLHCHIHCHNKTPNSEQETFPKKIKALQWVNAHGILRFLFTMYLITLKDTWP